MEDKRKKILFGVLYTILSFFLISFSGETQTTPVWQEPTCDPATNPEDCLMAAPLNTSVDAQTKEGPLTISSSLSVNSIQSIDNNITIAADGTIKLDSAVQINGSLILPTALPTAQLGSIYWDSTSSELKVYNGAVWQGTAVNVDNLVKKTGDTMTGTLNIDTSGIALNANSTGDVGVKGCYQGKNCGSLGTTSWSGLFEKSVYTDYDMVGNRFIPRRTQDSLYPYVREIINSDDKIEFNGTTYIVYDMAFDGTYMWAKAAGAGGKILKIRPSDLKVIYAYDVPYSGPKGSIIATGTKIIFNDNYLCQTYALDKESGSVTKIYETAYSSSCDDDIIYTGTGSGDGLIWMSDYSPRRLHYFNEDGTINGEIDIGASGWECFSPHDLAFDGENIWAACQEGGRILKMDKDCRDTSCTDKTVYNIYAYANSADQMLFDGTYFWVSFKGAGSFRFARIDFNACDAITKECGADAAILYEIPQGVDDIEYDGANVWVINKDTQQLYVIPAYGGSMFSPYSIPRASNNSFLSFDGTNIWESSYDGTTSVINLWATGNGGYGVSSPTHFQGIMMTSAAGNLYCAYVSGSPLTWTFAASGTADFDKYCNND